MSASPMAWVGMVAAMIAITTNVGTVGFIYASVLADAATTRKEVERNFKEDYDNRERTAKAVERIDTTIGSLGKLHVEIEVVKTQLTNLNENVRDFKRIFEERANPNLTRPSRR